MTAPGASPVGVSWVDVAASAAGIYAEMSAIGSQAASGLAQGMSQSLPGMITPVVHGSFQAALATLEGRAAATTAGAAAAQAFGTSFRQVLAGSVGQAVREGFAGTMALPAEGIANDVARSLAKVGPALRASLNKELREAFAAAEAGTLGEKVAADITRGFSQGVGNFRQTLETLWGSGAIGEAQAAAAGQRLGRAITGGLSQTLGELSGRGGWLDAVMGEQAIAAAQARMAQLAATVAGGLGSNLRETLERSSAVAADAAAESAITKLKERLGTDMVAAFGSVGANAARSAGDSAAQMMTQAFGAVSGSAALALTDSFAKVKESFASMQLGKQLTDEFIAASATTSAAATSFGQRAGEFFRGGLVNGVGDFRSLLVSMWESGAIGEAQAAAAGARIGQALTGGLRQTIAELSSSGAIATAIANAGAAANSAAVGNLVASLAQSQQRAMAALRFDELGQQLTPQFSAAGATGAQALAQSFQGQLAGLVNKFMPESMRPATNAFFGQLGRDAGNAFRVTGAQEFEDATRAVGGKMLSGWDQIGGQGVAAAANAAGKMSTAMKVGIVGGVLLVTDVMVSGFKNAFELINKEAEQFGKFGKDAGDLFMTTFSDVVEGKMPDLQRAIGVGLEGTQALIQAPFNAFSAGIDATVGQIPILGSAFKLVADEANTALGAIFEVFNEYKTVAGDFANILLDIGNKWQDVARTIAGQTIDLGNLDKYLDVTREIAASGDLVHFKDVADVVGELNQRLSGLGDGAGLTRQQLVDLASSVAEANELLGDIHINVDNLTAAFNDFNVPAEKVNETFTFMVNVARETGANFNEMARDIDQVAPALMGLGYSLEQVDFILGKMNEKLGDPAMNRWAFGIAQVEEHFEKLGYDQAHIDQAMGDFVTTIRAYVAAGDDMAALDLAKSIVSSSRTAQTLVDAIKKNAFASVEDIQRMIDAEGGALTQPLDQALEASKNLQQTIEQLSNSVLAALAPLGTALVDSLTGTGQSITEWLRDNQDKFVTWVGQVGEWLLQAGVKLTQGLGSMLRMFGPLVESLKNMTVDFLEALNTEFQNYFGMLAHIPDKFLPSWAVALKGMGTAGNDMIAPLERLRAMNLDRTMGDLASGTDWAAQQLQGLEGPLADITSHAANAAAAVHALSATFQATGQDAPEFQLALQGSVKDGLTIDPHVKDLIISQLHDIGVSVTTNSQGVITGFKAHTQADLDAIIATLNATLGPQAFAALGFSQHKITFDLDMKPEQAKAQFLKDHLGVPEQFIGPNGDLNITGGMDLQEPPWVKDMLEALKGEHPSAGAQPQQGAPDTQRRDRLGGGPDSGFMGDLKQFWDVIEGLNSLLGGVTYGGSGYTQQQMPGQVTIKEASAKLTLDQLEDSVGIPQQFRGAGTEGVVLPAGLNLPTPETLAESDVLGKVGIPFKYQDEVEAAGVTMLGVSLPSQMDLKSSDAKSTGEVMDALGIPSQLQGEDGATIPVSFAMKPGTGGGGGSGIEPAAGHGEGSLWNQFLGQHPEYGGGGQGGGGGPEGPQGHVQVGPYSGGGGTGAAGFNQYLQTSLSQAGFSPDEIKAIQAMNLVETGGAGGPEGFLGFTYGQAATPEAAVEKFINTQWLPRTQGGTNIPGVDATGRVTDWDALMNFIQVRIVGQTGNPSDWQGKAQPPMAEYRRRLFDALQKLGGTGPGVADTGSTFGLAGGGLATGNVSPGPYNPYVPWFVQGVPQPVPGEGQFIPPAGPPFKSPPGPYVRPPDPSIDPRASGIQLLPNFVERLLPRWAHMARGGPMPSAWWDTHGYNDPIVDLTEGQSELDRGGGAQYRPNPSGWHWAGGGYTGFQSGGEAGKSKPSVLLGLFKGIFGELGFDLFGGKFPPGILKLLPPQLLKALGITGMAGGGLGSFDEEPEPVDPLNIQRLLISELYGPTGLEGGPSRNRLGGLIGFDGGGPVDAPGTPGFLAEQLKAAGFSPDLIQGVLAMNQVESGGKPEGFLGFRYDQAATPQIALQRFLNEQWRPRTAGGIPGVDKAGKVTDWRAFMDFIQVKIVGQVGANPDIFGNRQPPKEEYARRLWEALGLTGPDQAGPHGAMAGIGLQHGGPLPAHIPIDPTTITAFASNVALQLGIYGMNMFKGSKEGEEGERLGGLIGLQEGGWAEAEVAGSGQRAPGDSGHFGLHGWFGPDPHLGGPKYGQREPGVFNPHRMNRRGVHPLGAMLGFDTGGDTGDGQTGGVDWWEMLKRALLTFTTFGSPSDQQKKTFGFAGGGRPGAWWDIGGFNDPIEHITDDSDTWEGQDAYRPGHALGGLLGFNGGGGEGEGTGRGPGYVMPNVPWEHREFLDRVYPPGTQLNQLGGLIGFSEGGEGPGGKPWFEIGGYGDPLPPPPWASIEELRAYKRELMLGRALGGLIGFDDGGQTDVRFPGGVTAGVEALWNKVLDPSITVRGLKKLFGFATGGPTFASPQTTTLWNKFVAAGGTRLAGMDPQQQQQPSGDGSAMSWTDTKALQDLFSGHGSTGGQRSSTIDPTSKFSAESTASQSPFGMQTGGEVPGAHWPGRDSVPMALAAGSYVVRRDQAQLNRDLLDAMMGGSDGHHGKHSTIAAIVQPGERLIPPKIAGANLAMLNAINYGKGRLLKRQGGGNVAEAEAWAASISGQPYNSDSYLDCSGYVSSVWGVMTGRGGQGRYFDTTAFATDAGAAAYGFLPGEGPEGSFRVDVRPLPGNAGHMIAMLPNGVVIESSDKIKYGTDTPWGSVSGGKFYYMPVGADAGYQNPSLGVESVDFPTGGGAGSPGGGGGDGGGGGAGAGAPGGGGGAGAGGGPGGTAAAPPPPPQLEQFAVPPDTPGAITIPGMGSYLPSYNQLPGFTGPKYGTPAALKVDEWLDTMKKAMDRGTQLQGTANDAQEKRNADAAVRDQLQSKYETDLHKALDDLKKQGISDADAQAIVDHQLFDTSQGLGKERKDAADAAAKVTQDEIALGKATDALGANRNQQALDAEKGIGKTAADKGVTPDENAAALGSGLIKGAAQELGFPDVFGKPPWQWGLWKLGAGAANYGLGLLNRIGDDVGKGAKGFPGMGGPGAPGGDQAPPGSPASGQGSGPAPGPGQPGAPGDPLTSTKPEWYGAGMPDERGEYPGVPLDPAQAKDWHKDMGPDGKGGTGKFVPPGGQTLGERGGAPLKPGVSKDVPEGTPAGPPGSHWVPPQGGNPNGYYADSDGKPVSPLYGPDGKAIGGTGNAAPPALGMPPPLPPGGPVPPPPASAGAPPPPNPGALLDPSQLQGGPPPPQQPTWNPPAQHPVMGYNPDGTPIYQFDSGGVLPPGQHWVINATGRPELVLDPDATNALLHNQDSSSSSSSGMSMDWVMHPARTAMMAAYQRGDLAGIGLTPRSPSSVTSWMAASQPPAAAPATAAAISGGGNLNVTQHISAQPGDDAKKFVQSSYNSFTRTPQMSRGAGVPA